MKAGNQVLILYQPWSKYLVKIIFSDKGQKK